MKPRPTRLVDVCLEAGVNLLILPMFYSDVAFETILGKAVAGRRDEVLISPRLLSRFGKGPNDVGIVGAIT